MKPYFIKTPWFVKSVFNKWKWNYTRKKKVLYLTFDDGPTPEITEWVLHQLHLFNAKATFFCIGKNIVENPEVYQKIISNGHTVGNHTHNHLNGFKNSKTKYISNIIEADGLLENKFKLFRPPYGKIKFSQANALRKLGYTIIMWDVLSADFDPKITKNECLNNVIANTENGSIIVFHDSIKASEKMKYVLPQILYYYSENGYEFKKIEC